jgi:hypothetical protein
MKEAKVTALPDNPPQIVVERPATDLVLSEPKKVPIVLSAYDDFGLADVAIATQRGDSGGFVGRPIKRYTQTTKSDGLVASLDLPALGLKMNEHIRYRIEVRDRKGQSAQTQEYVIRIAADHNAADRQLAEFEKHQDSFAEKLAKLIAEHANVREQLTKLPAKYAELEKALKPSRAQARTSANGAPEPTATPPLDPEQTKQLQVLREELGQLAGQEDQNAQLAQQVSNDLKQAAEQAGQLKMLPGELAEPMRAIQQEFQETAVGALQGLTGRMRQGTDAGKTPPDPSALKTTGEQIQRNLEAMKQRLDALARARQGLANDAAEALANLRQERAQQEAAAAAVDLKELRDFVAAMRQEMKRLEGNQEQLLDAAANSPELLLPDVENKQDSLDSMAQERIGEARAVQDTKNPRGMNRAPAVADAHDEDADEPRADAARAPDETAPETKSDTRARRSRNEEGGDDDRRFMPALGGPPPKLDPRYANRMRASDQRPTSRQRETQPKGTREQLRERGEETLQDLNLEEGSLATDQESLEALLRELQRDARGPDARRQQARGDERAAQAADKREDMTSSALVQEARAMAERMRAMRAAGARTGQTSNRQHAGQTTATNPTLTVQSGQAGNSQAAARAALEGLDLNTRTVILKMPPRVREELLRGMREQGPEGYAKFIQDYFRRLTEAKGGP